MKSLSSALFEEFQTLLKKSDLLGIISLVALFWLITFAWKSHAVTLFNGLATPLSFAVCAYLLMILSFSSEWQVKKNSLSIFLLLTVWILFVDTRSGQALPALARDTNWLLAMLLCLSFPAMLRQSAHLVMTLRLAASFCIVTVLITLFNNAYAYDNWHHPPIFGHIRHLGLSIGFFTLLLYLPEEDHRGSKLFFRLIRIGGLSLVIWSGTRASMLGIAIGITVCGLLVRKKQFWFEVLADVAVAAILSSLPPQALPGASNLVDTTARTLQGSNLNQVSSSRVSMWTDTLHWLYDNGRLLNGVGGNGFARMQTLWQAEIKPAGHVQPHNLVIQILSDWGIIGLTLFSALLLVTARTIFATAEWNRARIVALGTLIYLLVSSMFDASMYHLEFLVYFSVASGFLLSGTPPKTAVIFIPKVLPAIVLIGVIGIHLAVTDHRIGLSWYFPTH